MTASTPLTGRIATAGMAVVAVAGILWGIRALRGVRARPFYAVVVNLDEATLRPHDAHLTPPLEQLSRHAEIRLRRPPNGRGTQVLATARHPGVDVRHRLRAAKQQLETSEVLQAESWPAARGRVSRRLTTAVDRRLARGGWR